MDSQPIARTMLSLSVDEFANPTVCIIQHVYQEGLIRSCVDIQLDASSFSNLLFQMNSLESSFNHQKHCEVPTNSSKNNLLETVNSLTPPPIIPAESKRSQKFSIVNDGLHQV